jgi:DNA mismatch endonuclease (patch repair protein)
MKTMDTLSPGRRTENMRRVRGKNTRPEIAVRRLLHALGYRFRVHFKGLPGKPDIVFPKRKKVVFVHGCFWHQHPDAACSGSRIPKSRPEFWTDKLGNTQRRDIAQQNALLAMGWDYLIVWECQIRDREGLEEALARFLGPPRRGL